MEQYERVQITGYLEVLSDLHIGSGCIPQKVDDSEGSLITILRGIENKPYIPASSLRGYLKQQAMQVLDQHHVDNLFGYANEDNRQTGKLRVANAFFTTAVTTSSRHGIALDPITATTQEHMLFKHEVIPTFSIIQCEFSIEKTDTELLQQLLQLLEHWDGLSNSTLGAMTGKGYGRVKWQLEKVKVLNKENIIKWLESDSNEAELITYYQPLKIESLAVNKSIASLSLILYTNNPIVIHDPKHIDQETEHAPKITCSRTVDGHALIPGTSIKGLLRAWCRKIVMTILIQHNQQLPGLATEIADNYINALFGSKKLASYIRLSDAISPDLLEKHIRPMIAIDRFSGGVKGGQYLNKEHQQREHKEEKLDGSLVQIEAALNSQYQADISLHPTRIAPEGEGWKGLLLLALRDAMEEDFFVGWGKARGFGAFQVQLIIDNQTFSDWDTLYKLLSKQFPLEKWIFALHNELNTLSQQQDIGEKVA